MTEIESGFTSEMERVLFHENAELRKKVAQLLTRLESKDQEMFALKEFVRKRNMREMLNAVGPGMSIVPPSSIW